MIVLPISMSRISNLQSPEKYMEYLAFFSEKMLENTVGVNFLYSEGLYMNFGENVSEEKNHLAQNALSHKWGILKIKEKKHAQFQVDSAFHFDSWFQMYLAYGAFFSDFTKVKMIFKEDPVFQKYVQMDAEEAGKEYTEQQIHFYLEEHLVGYLLLHRKMHLENMFLLEREEWVLFAYTWDPPRGLIYLCQLDPFGLGSDTNPYKGMYNLLSQKFVDFTNVELETWTGSEKNS